MMKLRDSLDKITGKKIPIVRFPSGSYCFASPCAPWFSKSARKRVRNHLTLAMYNYHVLSHATVSKIMQLGFFI